jgi:hypothetical protein
VEEPKNLNYTITSSGSRRVKDSMILPLDGF